MVHSREPVRPTRRGCSSIESRTIWDKRSANSVTLKARPRTSHDACPGLVGHTDVRRDVPSDELDQPLDQRGERPTLRRLAAAADSR